MYNTCTAHVVPLYKSLTHLSTPNIHDIVIISDRAINNRGKVATY